MKANVGRLDRIVRIAGGLILLGLAAAGIGTPWTWLGVVPLATGVVRFCPAYGLLGLDTCPAKKQS